MGGCFVSESEAARPIKPIKASRPLRSRKIKLVVVFERQEDVEAFTKAIKSWPAPISYYEAE